MQIVEPIVYEKLHRLILVVFGALLILGMLFQATTNVHAQSHFTDCVSAGDASNNATVVIPQGVIVTGGENPVTGDEIAVFNPEGTVCAGVFAVGTTLGNQALTVWGDVQQTPALDGMRANEVMQWRIWKVDDDKEIPFTVVTYDSEIPFHPNGEYGAGRLYRLVVPSAIGLIQLGTVASMAAPGPLLMLFGLGLLLISLRLWLTRRTA